LKLACTDDEQETVNDTVPSRSFAGESGSSAPDTGDVRQSTQRHVPADAPSNALIRMIFLHRSLDQDAK
jgi:hypothetical protein